jgi:hypothetical protein
MCNQLHGKNTKDSPNGKKTKTKKNKRTKEKKKVNKFPRILGVCINYNILYALANVFPYQIGQATAQ